mmetsp:Transcript_112959/g.269214  ORF Transcript_112959/g.269214 Transcript_112959/m.269214 type:complete len:368 (-) Transcript_112959:64-1167(-)|eukprot:CAMPEP_0181471924 /NCGR_PEP_ID=MMETSP1110-20121109/39328_1 /TAXON_ID=174948 /ORGANISM="Symbiodinium sp., Strain CCMP421" /LENGTH=367 /DNA_ID=CAMNT_0023596963 /DNA_START=43 /DNA_END=1146 /DNA_ORIENTATION=-
MAMVLRALLAMLPLVQGGPAKLYCWSLVTPNTYEVGMLAGMASLGVGLFECNGYDIVSNVTADVLFKDFPDIANQLKDHVHTIDMDLFVKKVSGPVGTDPSSPYTNPNSPLYQGATMKHLANTPVFKEAWQKIFNLGSFQNYDFTAKLDVDAVIVPARLSGMLTNRPKVSEYFFDTLHDMYGNFLHGPIELISRLGMFAFRDARHVCFDKIDQMAYGEDFFAKQCWDMIGIKAVPTMDIRLLYDKYEWGTASQNRCDALVPDPAVFHEPQYYAVFHPYKDMASWLQCRRETGVPKMLSDAQVQSAVALATKPLTLYEQMGQVVARRRPAVVFLAGVGLVAASALLVSRKRLSARGVTQEPLVDEELE